MEKNWFKRNIANIITSLRIVGTILMLIFPTFSKGFFISYTFAGATDAIDGTVARKTGTVSKFGSKLDSAADLFFFLSMIAKLFTKIVAALPKPVVWILVGILVLRISYYIYFGVTQHRFVSNHIYLNKATGFLAFFTPYLLQTAAFTPYAVLMCLIMVSSLVVDTRINILQKNAQ
ncbi:MAG: CDP-alcohol phosphatidyltransferase family protein [Clostridia bacterium]|nr:CDP-alcohol phosphatidyltransferase family protein [Clostridia bacterium]